VAKFGRPSKYDPAYCEQVVKLGAEGLSEVQISARINVPRTTLRSWADQHSDFSSALTRAKELSQAWWEDKGQAGIEDRNFNAPLWKASVASRFREDYGEKRAIELTGKDGGPIQGENVDALKDLPTEALKEIREIMARYKEGPE